MEISNNPLLQKSQEFDGAAPLHLIKTEHYLPALKEAIKEAQSNFEAIKKQKENNFETVILALEKLGEKTEYISGIYFNLFSSEASPDLQALAQEISPLLSAFASDISLDDTIFQKVKMVYDNREALKLTGEDLRLTEKMYKDFTRNGALLSAEKKEELRKIDQELSVLSPQFSENVLKATNAFEMWITDKKDLAGLPENAIEQAALAAEQKGKKGQWLVTLHAPSLVPFLTYSSVPHLREKIWRANSSKCFNDSFDNQEIIKKLLKLKSERAHLLGFKNHGEYTLEERMAKDTDTVFKFLDSLLGPSKRAATRDLEEIKAFRKELEGTDVIKPWDFAYYSEKLKEKKYAFNEEELRPYFKLENVIQGVFEHARKLYGLTFKEVKNIPTYHPDVKTFEVYEEGVNDAEYGNYLGLFYMDFFPRETKRGGAWMTGFRDQGLWGDKVKRPHICIVCNFTQPTASKPSLLTYNEVTTLFHEFGHALHGLLSRCKYRSLAGTNVYWDFVELPSQIMENWAKEKEGLDLFATHYETGEKIPADLVEKIKKSDNFLSGWSSLRQISFALLDIKWFTADPNKITSVEQFENEAMKEALVTPREPGINMSCSFGHIFGGGYSAGYYSYKWAEVLDADAFEYFKEKGLFDQEVAKKFKNILSRGGTEHPMKLYKEFRGREPDANALLRRSGLVETE